MDQADAKLLRCLEETMKLYPPEYAIPVESLQDHNDDGQPASVLASHTLLPEVLQHAFSAYGALLQPDLPLSRRQHELIAATVSAVNNCFY